MSMENYIILAQPEYDIILLDAKIGIKLESDILQEYFPLGVKPLFKKKKKKKLRLPVSAYVL